MGVVPDNEKIKISSLPVKSTPIGSDYIVITDSEDLNNTKKSTIVEVTNGIDKAALLSTDVENLLSLGSDSKIIGTASSLISANAGNTIVVGTDDKLFSPPIPFTLTENKMLIGGVGDAPTEKTNLEVKSFLGLPEGYIKDTIEYVSATEIRYKGKCRDSSNSVDLELSLPVIATLSSAAANTTYHMFIGKVLPTDSETVIFSSTLIPAGYTYYRRVLSIKTDGLGNIIQPSIIINKGSMLTWIYSLVIYNEINDSLAVATTTEKLSVPNKTTAILNSFMGGKNNTFVPVTIRMFLDGQLAMYSIAQCGYDNYQSNIVKIYIEDSDNIEKININNANTTRLNRVSTIGFIDERLA